MESVLREPSTRVVLLDSFWVLYLLSRIFVSVRDFLSRRMGRSLVKFVFFSFSRGFPDRGLSFLLSRVCCLMNSYHLVTF